MELKPVTVGVVGADAISDICLTNMTTRFPILKAKSICAGHIELGRLICINSTFRRPCPVSGGSDETV